MAKKKKSIMQTYVDNYERTGDAGARTDARDFASVANDATQAGQDYFTAKAMLAELGNYKHADDVYTYEPGSQQVNGPSYWDEKQNLKNELTQKDITKNLTPYEDYLDTIRQSATRKMNDYTSTITKDDVKKQKALVRGLNMAGSYMDAKTASQYSLTDEKKKLQEMQSALEAKDQFEWIDKQKKNQELLQNGYLKNQIAEYARNEAVVDQGYGGYATKKDKDALDNYNKARKNLLNGGYDYDQIESLKDTYLRMGDAESKKAMEDSLNADLNKGVAQKLLHNAGSVGANLVSGVGMVENIDAAIKQKATGEYTPVNTNSLNYWFGDYRDKVRQNTSQAIEDKVQDTFDSEKLGKGLSLLYNAGMASADSFSSMLAGGPTGSTLALAAGAAAGTGKDTFERKGNTNRSLISGTAAGAIEYATEKIGMDNLWDIVRNSGKAAGRSAVLNFLVQSGIEGMEEAESDIANRAVDHLVNGGMSEYALNVEGYKSLGMSEQNAKKQANKDFWAQVAQDATVGAISGAMGAGAGTAASYLTGNRVNSRPESVNIDERANTDAKNAEKIITKEEQTPTTTNGNTETAASDATKQTDQRTYNPEPVDVKTAMETVKNSENVMDMAEAVRDIERTGTKEEAETARMQYEYQTGKMLNEGKISEEDIARAQNAPTEEQAYQAGLNNEEIPEENMTVKSRVAYLQGKNVYSEQQFDRNTVKKEEADTIKNAPAITSNGKEVTIQGIKTTDADPVVQTSAGDMKLSEVSVKNPALQKLYNNASMQESTQAAAAYIDNYPTDIMVTAYTNYYNKFLNAGKAGTSFENVLNRNRTFAQYVPEEGLRQIYEAGKNLVADNNSESNTIQKKGSGKVIDERTNKSEHPLMSVYEKIAEKTGQDIVLKDTDMDDINGSFNRSMSEIVLNTQSNEEYATLFHEAIGEFSESWAPKEMETFQSDLLEWFMDAYGDEKVNGVIKKYQDIYQQKEGEKSYREAANEMVNDALSGLFASDEGVEQFTNWLYENKPEKEAKGVIEKIADFIKELCTKIKNYVKGTDLNPAAKHVMQMEADRASGLRSRLLEIADTAAENYRQAKVDESTQSQEKHSFAGIQSEQADTDAKKRAQEMEERGATEEEILKETGWFRGADKKWRFEIDDSKATVSKDGTAQVKDNPEFEQYRKMLREGDFFSPEFAQLDKKYHDVFYAKEKPLENYLTHDELYESYPFLKNTKVAVLDEKWMNGAKAAYDSHLNVISITKDTLNRSDAALKRTLLHEVQHAIQNHEEFARGANDKTWESNAIDDRTNYQKYRMTAGEVEARNVADRAEMTAQQRRENMPVRETEDGVIFSENKEDPYTYRDSDSNEVSYKLVGKDENGNEIYETSEAVKDMSYKERINKLKDTMRQEYAGRTAKFEKDGKVYYAQYSPMGVSKGIYGDKKSNRKGLQAKINIGADGNYIELAENAQYIGTSPEQGKTSQYHKDAKEWDYYKKTIQSDGEYYDVLINIKDTGENQYVYDITLKKAAAPNATSALTTERTASTDTVADDGEKVNTDSTDSIKDLKHSLNDTSYLDDFWDGFDGFDETVKSSASILEEGAKALQGQSVDENAVRKIARTVKDEYHSSVNTNTLADNLTKVFAYMQEQPKANYEDMLRVMNEVATPVIEQSTNYDLAELETYQTFKKQLRDYRITLNDEQKAEVANVYGSYNDFRKSMFGTLNLVSEGGTSLDSIWGELSYLSGGMLDDTISYAEQPLALADALDQLKPQARNNFGADTHGAAMDLSLRIFEEYFKDQGGKQAESVRRQMVHERTQFRQKTQEKYKERLKEERRKLSDRYNQRTAEQVARARAYFSESNLAKSRRAKEGKYRESIKKNSNDLFTWMERPTDQKHVPDSLKKLTMEFLGSIDFVSHRAKEDSANTIRWQERMRRVQSELTNENLDSIEAFKMDLDPDFESDMKDFIGKNDKVEKLSQMDYEQLQQLDKLTRSLKSAIQKSYEFHLNNRYKTIQEAGNNTIQTLHEKDSRKAKGKAGETVHNLLNLDMLAPMTYFESMGEGGKSVWQEIRSGFDRRVWHIREAEDYTKEALKGKDIKTWTGKNAEVHEVQTVEGKMQLTTGQIMSLYAMRNRPQAMQHILQGGIIASEAKEGKKRILQNKPQHVTPEMFEKITDVLREEQKEVADKLQKFMAENVAAWGNNTSELMYGYRKFTDPNYFPIQTYSDTRPTNDQNASASNTSLYAVKNQGMTKALNKNANNALVADDFMDAYVKHVVGMATYDGFAAPLSDAMKWFNYKNQDMVDGYLEADSVKEEINRVLGKEGKDYFINWMKDLNGYATHDTATSISERMVSAYKGSAIGGNIRVAIQQPTAIARASMILPAQDLMAGMAQKPSVKEAMDHSAIFVWKSYGFFDTSLGKSMREIITGQSTISDQIRDKSSWLVGKADDVTWGAIWNACKANVNRTKKNLQVGSDEYFDAVTKLFDQVIDETQVVDTMLHRTQIMRSKNAFSKLATAFMSEPHKSYNMLYKAAQQDKKTLSKAVAIYGVNALLTSAAAAVMDAWRDDDFDKSFLQRYFAALGLAKGSSAKETAKTFIQGNIADNLNPLNMIPYAKDVISYLNGWDNERMDMAGLSNLVKSGTDLAKYVYDPEGSKKTSYGITKSMIRALSQVSGIPAYNLLREVETTAEQLTQVPWKTQKDNLKDLYGDLIRYKENGNTKMYDKTYSEVKDRLKAQGKGTDEIYWGMQEYASEDEDWSKYGDFYSAVESGKDLKKTVKRYLTHGVEKKTLASRITSQYKQEYISLYKKNKSKAASLKRRLLDAYMALGYDRSDKSEDIDAWLD